MTKQQKMRAKTNRRTVLKDLKHRQEVAGCWLGDYTELNRDDPAKFKTHGKLAVTHIDDLPGKQCIIIP